MTGTSAPDRPTVVELFAGVGGFHLALDRAGFDVIWSNQYEPLTTKQHAHDCYLRHAQAGDFQRFGRHLDASGGSANGLEGGHVCDNRDIETVLDEYAAEVDLRGRRARSVVPDADLVVGGFPCQDYSVAKPLRQAHGLVGKKGVLWWQIYRLLWLKREVGRPVRWLFLENVDRLVQSPSDQKGRDFAVMLASLADLGYEVEWRVVNAADYGFPQRRRRVFIIGRYGRLTETDQDPASQLLHGGLLARAVPAQHIGVFEWPPVSLGDTKLVSDTFGLHDRQSVWRNAGVMRRSVSGERSAVWTIDMEPTYDGPADTLGRVVVETGAAPPEFYVQDDERDAWARLKGRKSIERVSRSGHVYNYEEGAIPFPDRLDAASRTILTGEGGRSASRTKHVIEDPRDGRLRRLTPVELEKLNGFPPGWTLGMPDSKRAFMMGNALVVGIVERIARELVKDVRGSGR